MRVGGLKLVVSKNTIFRILTYFFGFSHFSHCVLAFNSQNQLIRIFIISLPWPRVSLLIGGDIKMCRITGANHDKHQIKRKITQNNAKTRTLKTQELQTHEYTRLYHCRWSSRTRTSKTAGFLSVPGYGKKSMAHWDCARGSGSAVDSHRYFLRRNTLFFWTEHNNHFFFVFIPYQLVQYPQLWL